MWKEEEEGQEGGGGSAYQDHIGITSIQSAAGVGLRGYGFDGVGVFNLGPVREVDADDLEVQVVVCEDKAAGGGGAGGPVDVLRAYLGTGEFEVLLSHNRATLLDRSAVPLFEEAAQQGIGVLNAAPYGGGMLSKGPDVQPRYAYGTGASVTTELAGRMQEVCARAGVPLAAAALQFSLRLPSVTSTVVGVSSPERVAQTLELAAVEVPDGVWEELEQLVPDRSGWLG